MKKLQLVLVTLIIVAFFNSCAIVQKPYVSYDKKSAERVTDRYEIYKAIESYPNLKIYYNEGVVDIVSVYKVQSHSQIGGQDISVPYYIIKYRYCKYYFTDYSEQMEALQRKFPELYRLYCEGKINITDMYLYVDKYDEIKCHISYTYNH